MRSLTPHIIVTGPPFVNAMLSVVLNPNNGAIMLKLTDKIEMKLKFRLSSWSYPIWASLSLASVWRPFSGSMTMPEPLACLVVRGFSLAIVEAANVVYEREFDGGVSVSQEEK